jgi:hypothetical protein
MNKKSSNARRITLWVKLSIVFRSPTVRPVKGFALAPASATNDLIALLDDKIGTVLNELFIDPKDWTEGRLNLRGRVIRRL